MVYATKIEWKRRFPFGPMISTTRKVLGEVLPSETVWSIVSRLGRASNGIRYFISVYDLTQAIIIYKVPKSMTISQWFEAEMEKARELFGEETAE